MSTADLRRQILAADDLPREPVEVPWTDEKLYVRALCANDYVGFVTDQELVMTTAVMAQLLVRTLVTEDGERIFTDADAAQLGDKNFQVISVLFGTLMRVSGLASEGEVEDRFGEAQDGDSSTG